MEQATREVRKGLYLSDSEAEILEKAATNQGLKFGTWARRELLKLARKEGK